MSEYHYAVVDDYRGTLRLERVEIKRRTEARVYLTVRSAATGHATQIPIVLWAATWEQAVLNYAAGKRERAAGLRARADKDTAAAFAAERLKPPIEWKTDGEGKG